MNHFNITDYQFHVFYLTYSIPAIFFSIFSGIFYDNYGVIYSFFAFSIIVFIWQILFALSVTYKIYYIAIIARAFLGIGA